MSATTPGLATPVTIRCHCKTPSERDAMRGEYARDYGDANVTTHRSTDGYTVIAHAAFWTPAALTVAHLDRVRAGEGGDDGTATHRGRTTAVALRARRGRRMKAYVRPARTERGQGCTKARKTTFAPLPPFRGAQRRFPHEGSNA